MKAKGKARRSTAVAVSSGGGGRGEAVALERVFWGLVAEGEKVPHVLIASGPDGRKFADAMRVILPPEMREKVTVTRAIVTVWVLGSGTRS